ncbi:NUDIX domain-containing protein [Pacificibacter marinus]|uniref:NUDIX domain-containing protein n=1 Tax=Pacificibacter marinus TaxID=658057 RepID=UPI001C077341|nr:NUDIX hydrolase [Pacificibacter marinus]MBU2866538.1 NUDIX hydrolase [Pacificibacter marinus]
MSNDAVDDFDGAKIAILRGEDVLTLLRDDQPDIAFPNQWDLPGGGREDVETSIQTVTRELFEELSVVLDPSKIVYHAKEQKSLAQPDVTVHFFVARWDDLPDSDITLGDEGQRWCWMPVSEYLSRKDSIETMRARLSRALMTLNETI